MHGMVKVAQDNPTSLQRWCLPRGVTRGHECNAHAARGGSEACSSPAAPGARGCHQQLQNLEARHKPRCSKAGSHPSAPHLRGRAGRLFLPGRQRA